MTGITALLFDIDGTILDTREFILQATEYTLAKHGYPVPERPPMASLVGIPFAEYYSLLTGSNIDTVPLEKTHRQFQLDNLALSVVYPDVSETLQALRAQGFKIAAVTSRSKETSLTTLEKAGIKHLFDTIISAEDAPELKPHPAPLLKALDILHVAPVQAIMIGDSFLDIEAGKSAGTKTVRVTYGFHTDRLHEPEPDYIIHNIQTLLSLI